MDREDITCPLCSKEFSSLTIESHVSKCLFLNESTSNALQETPKRSSAACKRLKKSNCTLHKGAKRLFVKSTNDDRATATSSSSSKYSYQLSATVSEKSTTVKDTKTLRNKHIPLAERMRPTTLFGYVGQEHVLGPQSVLSQLLDKAEIPSIILWGPPGCGKTSLANVIAHICKQTPGGRMRYVKLSAAMSHVSDVKEAIGIASNELKFGRRTIMFMDEIHRFNKLQQDIFLPHVEAGTITLIGATTENPSFTLNSALLSRCRVIVLEKLTTCNLVKIIKQAVVFLNGKIHTLPDHTNLENTLDDSQILCNPTFLIDMPTVQWLADTCDGDARIALGGLELAVQSKVLNEGHVEGNPGMITLDDVKDSLKKTHMLYDRHGNQHYDIISALHKSVRASDKNASLYWLTRMMSGGEDPVYIARRLVRIACEDIGLEDPKALEVAVHTMQGCKLIGMPDCDVLLVQCVTYLATAPKSRLMEDSLRAAQKVVNDHKGPQPSVPLVIRNAPTKLMKQLGYGRGYNILHKDESGLTYLPEELEGVNFFQEKASLDTSN